MEEYGKMARAKKIKKDEVNYAEFFEALKLMAEEKGIPAEFIAEKIVRKRRCSPRKRSLISKHLKL